MHCTNCGSPLEEGSAFCTNCGQPAAVSAAATAAAGVASGAPEKAPVPEYQKEFYKEKAQKESEKPATPTYQQVAPRTFPEPATKRALAMCLYVGLLPLIFGFAVRDKNDEFITFHLNQALVVFLASLVAALLSAVFIGVLLGIFVLVVAIMGIVSAYNGEKKEMPLLGKIKLVK